MKKLVVFLFALGVLTSCNNKEKQNAKDDVKKAEEAVTKAAEKTTEKVEEAAQDVANYFKEYKTKTGKSFVVDKKGDGSLVTVTVTPKGFEFGEEMVLKDVDPVSKIFLADLNNDGYEELYIVTTAAGSGSYGNIYGFSSNKDKSVTPISVPEITEQDLKTKFKGYMGHDVFYLKNGKLYRKYPVYKDTDSNAKPTGGEQIIEYVLIPGEATWILKVK